MKQYGFVLGCLALGVAACTEESTVSTEPEIDHLKSWTDGNNKAAILSYVSEVTDPGSEHFIPVVERIAVFDNDGTLWSEQPMYFQLFFALDRIKHMSAKHPEWRHKQAYKAVLEGNMDTLKSYGLKGIMQLIMTTHSAVDTEEFAQIVKEWTDTATHPSVGLKYTEMVYQPMLELLDYLRVHDFKTYIVSGGGMEFMRPWTAQVYGIPPEQVIGSSIRTVFSMEDGIPRIKRLSEMDFIDDKEGKSVAINKHIGRKPVFCVGNSDGDLQMMQWTASNSRESLMIYIHHTDAEREWAYDRESHIGSFDKALDEALEQQWIVVDMAKDWQTIYP